MLAPPNVLTGSRRRRITYGFVLAGGFGLVGLPLFALSVWPTVDHSAIGVNLLLMGLGVCLTSLGYAFGRIAVAACTEDGAKPVSAPTIRPYLVAGVALVIAVLALVFTLMTA
ncbi:hypothetical protein [Goodfellowiella coeruleoviolacea]|uniref:Transmembrane protein n=1 Tax=Goodfellowiella coeruleoviolacea TaxID=334858 RepID=A0AAE3KEL5_9PSEU|nr:hypothetical protein [Goodfellowiella coeruleoviolacea]MCP2165456.1 hypothetical protein [Goodfellowiella coeruleoviolacea]